MTLRCTCCSNDRIVLQAPREHPATCKGSPCSSPQLVKARPQRLALRNGAKGSEAARGGHPEVRNWGVLQYDGEGRKR